jgi:arsenite methyltransferase
MNLNISIIRRCLNGVFKLEENQIKKFVKERYSMIATKEESYCSFSKGSQNMFEESQKQAKSRGYSKEQIQSIPIGAFYGLGCGNPTAIADIVAGETVLDLGSGGGIDVFLASQKVGETGNVIGVDMTREMVEKAVLNAREGGYGNVEFKLGEIENLPIEEGTIDLIISNCVINLTLDKSAAYTEAFRVLKQGGRIVVSDLVSEGYIPEKIRKNFHAWSDCISGAMEMDEYLDTIKKVGFKDVEVIESRFFTEPHMDERLVGKIVSIQVRAFK